MQHDSQQKRIWGVLRAQKKITRQELYDKLEDIATAHITAYIVALRKAGYVSTAHGGQGHAIQEITILENVPFAPLFNRGVVKGETKRVKIYNIKEKEKSKNETLYLSILEAIILLGQEEFCVSELCKKLTELKHNDVEYKSSFTRRWLDRLEAQKVITCTGSYRNSKIYLVNLSKVKALKEEANN
ncbi:hypothetical protein SDC9_142982 [bioreactor metagenome]|uniref:Uncharacterized protein n=1 Tax=bioreactor metagenome TaxID=1076179 RepID=A0A645E2B4_9ZZZZ